METGIRGNCEKCGRESIDLRAREGQIVCAACDPEEVETVHCCARWRHLHLGCGWMFSIAPRVVRCPASKPVKIPPAGILWRRPPVSEPKPGLPLCGRLRRTCFSLN